MMQNGFYIFTDRREAPNNVAAADRATALAVREHADAVITRLHRIDWRHPALLVYREGGSRWSQVLLGLPPNEEAL